MEKNREEGRAPIREAGHGTDRNLKTEAGTPLTIHIDSNYNSWRFEDIWLDT